MRTLICGVGVQDGAPLPRLLLDDEYEVIGTSRDAMTTSSSKLTNLVILDKVTAASMAISDFHSILQALVKAEYSWNLKTRRNFD